MSRSLAADVAGPTVVHWGTASVARFSDAGAAPCALNVSGWGLFLGLASLSSAALEGSRRAGTARWVFALSGVSLLVLLAGFVVSSPAAQLAGAIWGCFLTLPAAGFLAGLVFRQGLPPRRPSTPGLQAAPWALR